MQHTACHMKPATCHMQRATWGTVNRYHCDIKIENALVAKDLLSGTFCVKLCDFTRLCHSVRPSLPPPLTLSTPHRHQLGCALAGGWLRHQPSHRQHAGVLRARGAGRRVGWAHPAHICAGTGPTPPTSAPGLGPPRPHLHRDRRARYLGGPADVWQCGVFLLHMLAFEQARPALSR